MGGDLDAIRSGLDQFRRALPRPEFWDVTARDRITRRVPLRPTPVEPCGHRRFRLIAATEQPNRNTGAVLRIAGLDVDHFLRHDRGRLCWEHDLELRIGRVFLVGRYLDAPMPYLTVTIELDRGPLADRVFEGYRSGSLTGVSVAYCRFRHHWPSSEERRRYDMRPGGMVVDESALLEVSCVKDPADVGSRILDWRGSA